MQDHTAYVFKADPAACGASAIKHLPSVCVCVFVLHYPATRLCLDLRTLAWHVTGLCWHVVVIDDTDF